VKQSKECCFLVSGTGKSPYKCKPKYDKENGGNKKAMVML
jgi:hypothetical protein